MPIILEPKFINGGGPSYPGLLVNNATDVLTALEDLLCVQLNWVTVSGSPVSLPWYIRSGHTVNGIRVWLQFTSSAASNIGINGRLDGTAGVASGTASVIYTQSFQPSSYLYAVADDETLCFYIETTINTSWIHVGGWLNRVNPVDGYAWVIGRYDQNTAVASNTTAIGTRMARRFTTTGAWGRTREGLTIGEPNPIGPSNYYLSTSHTSTNPINSITGKVELIPYTATYAIQSGTTTASGEFRGFHKFVYSGTRGLAANTQLQLNGKVLVTQQGDSSKNCMQIAQLVT